MNLKSPSTPGIKAEELFYAMWISDYFMECVEQDKDWYLMCPNQCPGLNKVWGDEYKKLYTSYVAAGKYKADSVIKAKELFKIILQRQLEKGVPYILYKDACNRKSNQSHLGTIESSNLCVAPETRILTDVGHIPIKDLVNQQVNVWNSAMWSKVIVKQTGTNQPLITVTLSDGAQLTCTPYHKFVIRKGYTDKCHIASATKVEAHTLVPGTKLAKWECPVIAGDSSKDFKYAYTHGFFCGDGTYNNDRPHLALYDEKKDLIPYLDIRSTSGVEDASGRINTSLHHDLELKFRVPHGASLKCRLEWLAGLLDADGTVARNGKNESFQISSIEFNFLQEVRLLLQTMGVQSKVTKMHDEEMRLMPDGRGGQAMFKCKTAWRILISSSSVHSLKSIGLETHRLKTSGNKPQRNAEQFVTVVSVEDKGRTDDTYCFTEPIMNLGVFNGICTGNCSEIVQYTSYDEVAVCNLASISLAKFCKVDQTTGVQTYDYKELYDVTRIVCRNLNKIIDVNFYPIEEASNSNMRHRPIGLGVQGLADTYMKLRLPFDSEEAYVVNRKIFETIYFAALTESCAIAEKVGSYSTFKGSLLDRGIFHWELSQDRDRNPMTVSSELGWDWENLRKDIRTHGTRNSLLIALMPTGSTSQILGNVECFEPIKSNIFQRGNAVGDFIVVNEMLVDDLIKLGLWNDQIAKQIENADGMIGDIETIPKHIRDLYKSVWEIESKHIINQAIERGAFVDQAASMNLFEVGPTVEKLSRCQFHIWRRGGKNGNYYVHTRPEKTRKVTTQTLSCDSCSA